MIPHRSQRAALGARWAYVSAVTLAGVPVFFIMLAIGQSVADHTHVLPRLSSSLVWFSGVAVSTSCVVLALRLLRPRLSHFRESMAFPMVAIPATGSIAISLSIWIGNYGPTPGPDQQIAGLILLSGGLGWAFWRITRDSDDVRSLPKEPDAQRRLFDWVSVEEPATPNEPDFFDAALLATRLRKLLTGDKRERAVALIGPFGSGKSTVLAHLEAQLASESDPRVWSVSVSCWGLEGSVDTPRYILEQAIESLDERVDTHCLRGLPDAYQRLVDGTSGGLLESIGIRAHWSTVIDLLENVLEAVGARLVLLIEDSDRHPKDFDPHHLARLLAELRRARNITFILATEEQLSGIDLHKVCDHLVKVPEMEPASVRKILHAVRTDCRGRGVIDPFEADRERLFTTDDSGDRSDEIVRRHFGGGVVDAVVELFSTPRQIKHGARRILRAWDAVKGEVDPDELIVLCTLAECEPVAYDFLYQSRHALRISKDRTKLGEGPDALLEEWHSIKAASRHPEGLERMVEFLGFPRLASISSGNRTPQSVGGDTATDYFRRQHTESILTNEPSDQEVLRFIDEYAAGRKATLLARLVESTERRAGFLGTWEDLSDRHEASALLSLTSEVLEALRRRDGARASGRHEAVLALWRRANKRLGAGVARDQWLTKELEKALEVSLAQANDLYYFWGSVRYGCLTPRGREHAREALVTRFASIAVDPTGVAGLLSDEVPWALAQLRAPNDQEDVPSGFTDAASWSFMVPVFLSLLERNPAHIAAHVVWFVGQRGEVQHPNDLGLNEDLLRAIAGDRLTELATTIDQAATHLSKFPRFASEVKDLVNRLSA